MSCDTTDKVHDTANEAHNTAHEARLGRGRVTILTQLWDLHKVSCHTLDTNVKAI